KSAYMRF
uniref:FMRFamide-like neuropeptide PF3 n=2 Tax=Rhabditida TaxID=6236 RepID=FAR3_PANRE|nr:RecName: Full=FMRFamide-like neuropeptide PF3; AltName: Full=KSAYMRF-amide [Panagrellus redivivus]P81298.1 RecName: Full=FMRFamide-like neuropeptide PF3; AltName: Full=KSAYMRF-amide [Haemonchus contortus]